MHQSAHPKNIREKSQIPANKLRLVIKDLEFTRPWRGFLKFALLLTFFIGMAFGAFYTRSELYFLLFSFTGGLIAASLLILTHDAIHHTLTGWQWFDDIAPRITNSILWFHGVYKEIHKIHHKMNGDDTDDPERVQWTVEEFKTGSVFKRFYIRHQWFFDIFIFAGIGLIFKTLLHGLKHFSKSRAIRREFLYDILGITAFNVIIYGIALSNGTGFKYFLFWFILERISGGILQWRAHIEHYGLWGKGNHFFETQILNCRNITTRPFISWYFNHLNFHSVHHAFPRVPFYHLKEAHERFKKFFREEYPEFKMPEENGYIMTSLKLAQKPILIGPPSGVSLQRVMIPVPKRALSKKIPTGNE